MTVFGCVVQILFVSPQYHSFGAALSGTNALAQIPLILPSSFNPWALWGLAQAKQRRDCEVKWTVVLYQHLAI